MDELKSVKLLSIIPHENNSREGYKENEMKNPEKREVINSFRPGYNNFQEGDIAEGIFYSTSLHFDSTLTLLSFE